LEVLEKQGCDARVLQMEGAKDPDEYVVKYGSGRFNLLVDNAISLVEFKIKMLKSKYNLDNAKDKIGFLKEITKILSNVDNKIEREIYIDKISTQYNISKEAIYSEVNKRTYNEDAEESTLTRKVTPKKEETVEVSSATIKRENMIIYLLINHFQEAFTPIVTNISEDDFKFDLNKKLYKIILESSAEDSEKMLQVISNIEDQEIQSHVSEILVTDYEISSIDKCLEDIIATYSKERLSNRKLEIIKTLENSKSLSKEEVDSLEKELSEVIIELAKK
jgi:DNA primase